MKNLKQFLKEIPLLRFLYVIVIKRFKNKKYINIPPNKWLEKLITDDNVNIIQIGSNDGKHGDPIYDLIKKNISWNVLFVEPIPYLFERLKKNYGDEERFSFENAAINEGRKQIFYSVKEEAKIYIPNLPDWYDQLGSFNKKNILKHLDGVLEPYIVENLLSGLSLKELFEKYNIQDITLLHIDTEGYDWRILSQLDINMYKPKLILFEHKHLDKLEKDESIAFLKKHYIIHKLKSDYMCVYKNQANKLNLKEFKKNVNQL